MNLKIVSPTEIVFEGDVDFVVLPGSIGQLGILPKHAPLLSTLKEGRVRIRREKTGPETFDISGGFVEVLKDRLTLLAG